MVVDEDRLLPDGDTQGFAVVGHRDAVSGRFRCFAGGQRITPRFAGRKRISENPNHARILAGRPLNGNLASLRQLLQNQALRTVKRFRQGAAHREVLTVMRTGL